MATKKKPKPPRFFRFFDTTIPRVQTCQRCGVWLAAGIAEGMHVKADLVALDRVQAALAVLAGLRLYALTRTGLVDLDAYRLQDPKFGTPYPQHRCGTTWESRLKPAGAVRRADDSGIPPY